MFVGQMYGAQTSVNQMSVDQMSVSQVFVDQNICQPKVGSHVPVNQMSVDPISVDKMSIDQMSVSLTVDQNICRPNVFRREDVAPSKFLTFDLSGKMRFDQDKAANVLRVTNPKMTQEITQNDAK